MPNVSLVPMSVRTGLIALAALLLAPSFTCGQYWSSIPRGTKPTLPPIRSVPPATVGNVLDANLGVGTGGYNPSRSPTDFNARNLIVTDDVAGGRGFRGSVGYAAVGDFTAPTGADDTFAFRARSAGTGIPSLDLLRSPDPMAAGQQMGLIEQYRRTFFNAPTNPATGNLASTPDAPSRTTLRGPIYGQNPAQLSSFIDQQIRLDQILAQSATNQVHDAGYEPSFLGFVDAPDGRTLATDASSLRGLRYTPREWLTAGTGLTTLDVVRAFEDAHFGRTNNVMLGRPFEPAPFNSSGNVDPLTPALDQRQATGVQTGPRSGQPTDAMSGYREIVSTILDRYGSEDDAKPEADSRIRGQFDKDLGELKKYLNAGGATSEPSADDGLGTPGSSSSLPSSLTPRSTPDSTPSGKPGTTSGLLEGITTPSRASDIGKSKRDEVPDPLKGAGTGTLTDPEELAKPRTSTVRERLQELRRRQGESDAIAPLPSPIDVRDFGEVLRHGKQIEHFAAADQTRFNELMVEAEQKMAAGEYFAAERRFTRAARYTPGHPYAIAGVMNSQLGAGLYLSAALMARTLFTNQPEMIDVRYRGDLLPKPQQLTKAVSDLRGKLVNPKSLPEDMPAYAMLLAYIGRQTDDRPLTREGLHAMRQHAVGDPLVTLLEAVWLGDDMPAAPATQQPAPQAAPPEPPAPAADDSK